jgi:hypothetical protein
LTTCIKLVDQLSFFPQPTSSATYITYNNGNFSNTSKCERAAARKLSTVSSRLLPRNALTTFPRAIKEEHKIQLQLEALQLKLKKLRRHGKSLDTKADASRTATEDAMLAYAKNVCLEFCTKVHQTFPREVRDCIYGYITGCEDVMISELPLPISRKGSRVPYFDSSCETEFRNHCRNLDPDHWWLAEFTGAEMVRELGENYYRTTCFHFKNSLNVVSKFRVTDQWNLGFPPVSFVSNIEVAIKCNGHRFEGTADDDWAGSQGLRANAKVLLALESLFGFKTGTALTVNIYMSHHKELGEVEKLVSMDEDLVPLIFPTLQRLKETGLKVRLTIDTDRNSVWDPERPWDPDHPWKFTSAWNPTSLEDVTERFFEVC